MTQAGDGATYTPKTSKPKWSGGRHPLARLFRGILGALTDEAMPGDIRPRQADELARDADQALEAGQIPAKLAKRIKRVAMIVRQWDELYAEADEINKEVYELFRHVELARLKRARTSGKYDAEDLNWTEFMHRGDVPFDRVCAEHAEK
jgi:hypothetical protein